MGQNKNKNKQVTGDYYIGLDVGTSSVGWAVSDFDYKVLRFHGRHMWGVRLFEEAKTAQARRSFRTSRRRLHRRKQRLNILEMLFAEEIAKKDPHFFERMHESALWMDDKKQGSKFSLFNDLDYSDCDYHKEYPTIYHLRNELAESNKEHDVRHVFLALHHIMKYRGHFLDTGSSFNDVMRLPEAISSFFGVLRDAYGIEFFIDKGVFSEILTRSDIGISVKKRELKSLLSSAGRDEDALIDVSSLCDLLAGANTQLHKLFCDELLRNESITTVSIKENFDEKADELADILGERVELLFAAKDMIDAARLTDIIGSHSYISGAKVALYEKNKKDLRILKEYVKVNYPKKKKKIFSYRSNKLNNFPAYIDYRHKSGEYTCSQEDFCKFLDGEIQITDDASSEIRRIAAEIKERTFLTKLRSKENGLIPYQLQKKEMEAILHNAATYLPCHLGILLTVSKECCW